MQSWSSKDFTADRAWGALDIANFSGTTVRLHWTDQPYIWHINDGQEVFAVMDGQVAMHVKVDGEEQIIMLNAGDIFYAGVGCEHVAHPQGERRVGLTPWRAVLCPPFHRPSDATYRVDINYLSCFRYI